jgi:hypothetical protein
MAYIPEMEPDEKLFLQIGFKISKKSPGFNFAVSDRAIYWPETKTFAIKDATYFRRIRNNSVAEVYIKRLAPYAAWLMAALMIIFGLVFTGLMLFPLVDKEPGDHLVSGWPIAIFVGGVILSFAARGRLGLEIRTHDKKFAWKPPFVLDKASKLKIRAILDQISSACEKSGLRVIRK